MLTTKEFLRYNRFFHGALYRLFVKDYMAWYFRNMHIETKKIYDLKKKLHDDFKEHFMRDASMKSIPTQFITADSKFVIATSKEPYKSMWDKMEHCDEMTEQIRCNFYHMVYGLFSNFLGPPFDFDILAKCSESEYDVQHWKLLRLTK